MSAVARRAAIIVALWYLHGAAPPPALGQERLSLDASLLFYGDNTEFRTFRDGETLLGTAIRLFGAAEINDRVSVRLGAAANHRYGSDDAFEFVRPMVALVIRGSRSTFIFGSLETTDAWLPAGPDRGGPHGLLPPLQHESLSYDRPHEAGLQWKFRSIALRHETWINWQRVNTPAQRERFDVGTATEWAPAGGHLALAFQGHVVHEGGQVHAAGPVSDSYAFAPGVLLRTSRGRLRTIGFEVFGLASRFVPDREQSGRTRNGAAVFIRAEASTTNWRGHLIVWRGDDYLKDEGDANYLSRHIDGRRYLGVRDYSEAGLTRFFRPAERIAIEVSGRVYRIEPHNYEYSYRVVARTDLHWPIR
ncbi:MAG TPA: hypothetical protein VK886_08100 [Vicinamibacterales bacterium]|nr:hypothetical protein [Vicinamibacterales bacterium]